MVRFLETLGPVLFSAQKAAQDLRQHIDRIDLYLEAHHNDRDVGQESVRSGIAEKLDFAISPLDDNFNIPFEYFQDIPWPVHLDYFKEIGWANGDKTLRMLQQ